MTDRETDLGRRGSIGLTIGRMRNLRNEFTVEELLRMETGR